MVENGMILDGYWGKNDLLNCDDYDDDEQEDNFKIDLKISVHTLTEEQAEEIADEINHEWNRLDIELDRGEGKIIVQGGIDERDFQEFYRLVESYGLPIEDKMFVSLKKA